MSSYSAYERAAKRSAKFCSVRGMKSPPLNSRDSYLRDGVKGSCVPHVFPRRADDQRATASQHPRMYDPSPAKHFDGRFTSYITWNCCELSDVYTSLDKCIDRGRRQGETRKTTKKNQKRHEREKESTTREREESSRNTLTGSPTAAFGVSKATEGGFIPRKLHFLAIGTAD